MKTITYRHAPTLRAAAMSSASVRLVQGPVESGKTTWGIGEIWKQACLMPRCLDGIRRSRWLITRQTDGELQRGPIRSWKQWFPENQYGPIVGSAPAIHRIKVEDVELEVEFFAFADDSVNSMKRLRSVEYTGVYINEGQYVSLDFVKYCQQRTGRFPSQVDCPGYDRKKRVILDMNAPPRTEHWVHYMRGDIPIPADMPKRERRKYFKPDSWEFFIQPPSVLANYDEDGEIDSFEINPAAENLPFQNVAEIMDMVSNGDIDDIKRDYMNLCVEIKSGVPRYPKFDREVHVSKVVLEPVENVPPIIGYDPGINGAATIWQHVNNQWRCFNEIFCRDNPDLNSAKKTGDRMIEILNARFPWWRSTGVRLWGDPFGHQRQTSEEDTYYIIIGELGLHFQTPAPKDNPSLRWEAGKKLVSARPDGNPRLLVDGINAPMLVDGLDGGCTMSVEKMDGGTGVRQVVNKKSKFADIVESGEYAWWGGGEVNMVVESPVETPAQDIHQGRSIPAFSRRGGGVSSRGGRGGVFTRGGR